MPSATASVFKLRTWKTGAWRGWTRRRRALGSSVTGIVVTRPSPRRLPRVRQPRPRRWPHLQRSRFIRASVLLRTRSVRRKQQGSTGRLLENCKCSTSQNPYRLISSFVPPTGRIRTDPLVGHGRHFGRTVRTFCRVHMLISNGLSRTMQLELERLTEADLSDT
jgi:hypothetical protein